MKKLVICLTRWQVAVLSVVLLVISTILALQYTQLSHIEIELIRWVYNWPSVLTPAMLVITQLGSVWFGLLFIGVLMLWHQYRLGLRVGLVVGLAYVAAYSLKLIVQRPRPPELVADIISREALTYGFGFPSGHTAVAFAVGLTIWRYFPKKYRWTLIITISLIALSRIYLGVHAPLDILAGACIGVLAALAVSNIRRLLPGIKTS